MNKQKGHREKIKLKREMLILFVRRMQEQRRLHEEQEFNKTRPQRKIIKQLAKMKEEIIGLRKKLRSKTKLLEVINHKPQSREKWG